MPDGPRLMIEDMAIAGKIVTVLVCRQTGKAERIFSLTELRRDGRAIPLPSLTEAREAFEERSRDV